MATPASQVTSDPEFVRIAARYDLYKQIVRIGYILASAVPIWAMVPIAQAFAGHQTNLTVTITAGITATAILGGGNAWQYVVGRGRRKELQRLRERISKLEEEVKAAKGQK